MHNWTSICVFESFARLRYSTIPNVSYELQCAMTTKWYARPRIRVKTIASEQVSAKAREIIDFFFKIKTKQHTERGILSPQAITQDSWISEQLFHFLLAVDCFLFVVVSAAIWKISFWYIRFDFLFCLNFSFCYVRHLCSRHRCDRTIILSSIVAGK